MTALDHLKSSNTALLVIDKQLSYTAEDQVITRWLGTTARTLGGIVKDIDRFIEVCRSKSVPVVWTQMIEDAALSPANIASKMGLQGTPAISTPDTPSFGFNGLGPNPDEKVIVKKYYDAFADTDLDEYLQGRGVENLILVGGYASRCVLATAFGANDHGYNVFVVKELVGNLDSFADETPVALNVINSILGYSVNLKDIVITQ